MTILNPMGWLLLAGLPILYYLSKKNNRPKLETVPYLGIWQELYGETARQQKKMPNILLLCVQSLLIFCAVLGMLDLYRTQIADADIVLLYDRSISTDRINDFQALTSFVKANDQSRYHLIFIDDAIEEAESLLGGDELLRVIAKTSASYKPLDLSLLKAVYETYEAKNETVVVCTDKVEVDLERTIHLSADAHNVGLRLLRYDPYEATLSVILENDYHAVESMPLIIALDQKEVYESIYYLEPHERRQVTIECADFMSNIDSNNKLLTVRLAVEDSLSSDNIAYITYMPNLSIHMDPKDKSISKVVDLMPYVETSENGVELIPLTEWVKSSVEYDQSFIEQMKNVDWYDEDTIQSPYFPLWIEDHLYATYLREVDKLNDRLPTEVLPAYYTVNANLDLSEGHYQIDSKPLGQTLPPMFFLTSFMVLLVVEEEVRKRV